MLAKVQIIFCYIFLLFILIPYYENFSHNKYKFNKNNYHKTSIILIIFFYFLLQIYLNINFSQFRYLDLIFFLLIYLFFLLYKKIYFFIYGVIHINFDRILFYFFSGSLLGLLIILGLDFLYIIKFSEKNILRLTNPFHYLSAYSSISPFTDKNLNLLHRFLSSITQESEFLKINTTYNFVLFYITCFMSLLALFKSHNKFFFKYAIIAFCYIFLIIFITFKFRQNSGGVNTSYYIYFKPILLSILFLSFNLFRFKILYIFATFLLVATAVNTIFFFKNFYPYNNITIERNFFYNFNRDAFIKKNCKNNFWNDDLYENYFLRLTPSFNKDFYIKLCKQI